MALSTDRFGGARSLAARSRRRPRIEFRDRRDATEHVAIVVGQPDPSGVVPVRAHSSCFTGDLLASLRCDCGDQLHMALEMISQEGAGVLVYLPQEGGGIGLVLSGSGDLPFFSLSSWALAVLGSVSGVLFAFSGDLPAIDSSACWSVTISSSSCSSCC